MPSPPIADPLGPLPPALFETGSLEALPWASGVLLLSFGFALLRSSLQYSRSARVADLAPSKEKRDRIVSLLDRVDRLSASASIFKVTCDLIFLALVLVIVTPEVGLRWTTLLVAIAITGPVILFFTDSLPTALARRHGDRVLLSVLPVFNVFQKPVQVLTWMLEGINSATMRVLGVPEETAETREMVKGLREVIGESARRNDLDDTERELIENVMEFSDVDVAAIMTPRTEIHGVDIEEGMQAVVRIAATEGHSSIPIYEENLDNVVGYISARGIVQMLSGGGLDGAQLKDHLRPAYFVPETKLVTHLLGEFRRGKRKMAIVLDEYGGTAGMVTLGDILGEIVGDIGDEYDREGPEPVQVLSPGSALIEASLRIAEVNEAMGLHLSEEEGYETLGGYVLAELGHFPKIGEGFEEEGGVFEVTEATDRRVIRVLVKVVGRLKTA